MEKKLRLTTQEVMKIRVLAHPNSKKPRIETDLTGILHVYVSAPPLEGKANSAVLNSLAIYFKVSKTGIKLTSGTKSRMKVFEINTVGAS